MSVREPSGITLKGLNISKVAGRLVRRKVDVRTVCIALEVDADASEKLHQTRRLYGQACDMLVPVIVFDTDRKDRLWQRSHNQAAKTETLREVSVEMLRNSKVVFYRAVSPSISAALTVSAIRSLLVTPVV